MPDKMTLGQLHIKCGIGDFNINECKIHAKAGEHTRVAVACMAGDSGMASLFQLAEGNLEISARDGDTDRCIFSGIVQNVKLAREGQYSNLRLQGISRTWEMDIRKKSRSFQDVSQTYKSIIGDIAREYGMEIGWHAMDRGIGFPLTQYRETDYAFVKRLASHLGCCIIPTCIHTAQGIDGHSAASGLGYEPALPCNAKAEAGFSVGIGGASHIQDIEIGGYAYKIIPYQDILPGGEIGYEIAGMGCVEVGDALQIQGKEYYVMETLAELEGGILKYTCKAFPKECFNIGKINAGLKGIALAGEILERSGEDVKLHLDIDKVQGVKEAYGFPWRPATGNFLYCMPEEGTKAALYFGGDEESTAEVIYNIRGNGELCSELSNPDKRYFTTYGSKRMYMEPSKMGLCDIKDKNAGIGLSDGECLDVTTANRMSLLAQGTVSLKGKKVSLRAMKEATLVKKDILTPAVINLCNAFDAIGETGSFVPSGQGQAKKGENSIPPKEAERYSLEGAVTAILSNIPACSNESPAMQKIAGSMPIISKM